MKQILGRETLTPMEQSPNRDRCEVIFGDALTELRKLPSESVQCCVTSPPYWGLRDYSTEGQLGLEKTPQEYVGKLVEIFREVRRVLRRDGTLWLNLGDSYAQQRGGRSEGSHDGGVGRGDAPNNGSVSPPPGLKPKDLCGIPWRIAFALQADGWWLRQDIVWNKPNPMPESVADRCTKAHEYIFLLTKSARYFYDAEAIKEPSARVGETGAFGWMKGATITENDPNWRGINGNSQQGNTMTTSAMANKRSVWTIATIPYSEAHFATFPEELPKLCILAGTSARGCCGRCGSPLERVVEQTGPSTYAKIKGDRSWREMSAIANKQGTTPSRPNSGQTRFENGTQPHLDPAPTKTLGWQPTCLHEAEIEPCTVLDPFAGSGTAGQVALELSRKAILIELNPKYIELIRQRCTTTIGLAL